MVHFSEGRKARRDEEAVQTGGRTEGGRAVGATDGRRRRRRRGLFHKTIKAAAPPPAAMRPAGAQESARLDSWFGSIEVAQKFASTHTIIGILVWNRHRVTFCGPHLLYQRDSFVFIPG